MTKIREAQGADILAMVDLMESRRNQLQSYQPVFWNKAKDSAEKTVSWFEELIVSDKAICLIGEEGDQFDGFLIATETPAPRVYDPGGATWTIDDFAVSQDSSWARTGGALLRDVKERLKANGVRQIVVVNVVNDLYQRQILEEAGLDSTTLWFTQTL